MFVPSDGRKRIEVSVRIILSRCFSKSSPGPVRCSSREQAQINQPNSTAPQITCTHCIRVSRNRPSRERQRGHFFAAALIVSAHCGHTFVSTVSLTLIQLLSGDRGRVPFRPADEEVKERAEEMQKDDRQHPANFFS